MNEYELAKKEIPNVWYESFWPILVIACATGALTYEAYVVSPETRETVNILLSTAGSAFVYVVGRLMDKISTKETMIVVHQADGLNIDHPVVETNMMYSEKPTPEEVMSLLRSVPDIIVFPVATLFPPLGVAVGLGSALAALNNKRKSQRLRRAIELAEAQI